MSDDAKVKRLTHLGTRAIGLMAEIVSIHSETDAMANRKTVSMCPCALCHDLRMWMIDMEAERDTPIRHDVLEPSGS